MIYFWITVIAGLIFLIGMAVGAKLEKEYWISHATHGGAVYCKGYFYKVTPESEDDDDDDS